jgi:hypothetical protein
MDRRQKVDEYQAWLLDRYGLSELSKQDKEEAGQVLKSKLDENFPGSSWDYRPIGIDYDIEVLKFDFALCIPTFLNKRIDRLPDLPIFGGDYRDWDIGNDLPFPPTLVEKITEEDLEFLKTTFNLTEKQRYTFARNIYWEINNHFIPEPKDRCKRIIEFLLPRAPRHPLKSTPEHLLLHMTYNDRLPKGVPVPPLFLASAKAYLIYHEINSSVGEVNRINSSIRGLVTHAEEQIRILKALGENNRIGGGVKRIQLGVTLGEVLTKNGDDLLMKRVEAAIESGEFQIGLKQDLTVGTILDLIKFGICVDLEDRKEMYVLWRDDVILPNAPANLDPKSKPKVLYHIFSAVAEYITENWKKRKALKLSEILFEEWGMIIAQAAARKAKERNK